MKRWAIVGTAVLSAILVPLMVRAGTGGGSSALERQTFRFRSDPVSTSSREWRNIPGLGFLICARHEDSFELSLTLSGAPVLVKVGGRGVPASARGARPGPARFEPGMKPMTFTAVFADHARSFEANFTQGLGVQWRSPTGQPVTLHLAIVNASYELGPPGGGGIC